MISVENLKSIGLRGSFRVVPQLGCKGVHKVPEMADDVAKFEKGAIQMHEKNGQLEI